MGILSKNRPFDLIPYTALWAQQFESIKSEIAPLFGDCLVSIDHVGSTAIACEDMLAKPNIDICVVVSRLEQVSKFQNEFLKYGYTYLGTDYVGDGGDYIVKDDLMSKKRKISIHIYEVGSSKPEMYRAFRDYLIQHPVDRMRYVELKKSLYSHHKNAYINYDKGKTDLIEDIKAKALRWFQSKNTTNAAV